MTSPATMTRFTPEIADKLKQRVKDSGLSLRAIAHRAGVSYWALQRWVNGNQRMYHVDSAEAVHHALTGRKFDGGRGR